MLYNQAIQVVLVMIKNLKAILQRPLRNRALFNNTKLSAPSVLSIRQRIRFNEQASFAPIRIDYTEFGSMKAVLLGRGPVADSCNAAPHRTVTDKSAEDCNYQLIYYSKDIIKDYSYK